MRKDKKEGTEGFIDISVFFLHVASVNRNVPPPLVSVLLVPLRLPLMSLGLKRRP